MADETTAPTPSSTSVPAIKPGFTTSEGLLSFAVAFVGALLAAGKLGNGTVAVIAGAAMAALSALGYGQSRATVKAAHVRALSRRE